MTSLVRSFTVGALLIGFLLAVFSTYFSPVQAHPHKSEATCEGIAFAGGDCDGHDHAEEGVSGVISTIIDILSIIVGALSVIMIIIGGLRYITSSGDSAGVTSAKNTILYAIVGLIIVIFAQTIVKFIVGRIATAPADNSSISKILVIRDKI